jgi:hypothetical protein
VAADTKRLSSGFEFRVLSFKFAFLAVSVALVALSVYRAATYPFTHDESLSYAIFHGEPLWLITANHHVLNTWLMRASSLVLGDSAFALRLPNVTAHAVYLVAVVFLVSRLRSRFLQVCAFVLLALNLFVLDFFALARGYGLGLAGLAVSLELMMRAFERDVAGGRSRLAAGSLIAAAVGLLATHTLLYVFVALWIVNGWLIVTERGGRRLAPHALVAGLSMFVAGEAFVAFEILKVSSLQHEGQLTVGGHVGFVHDTITTLVQASRYIPASVTPDNELVIEALGWAPWAIAAVAAVLAARRTITPFVAVAAILAFAVASPVAQHRLAGTLFPTERAALPYIPLFAIALVFCLDALQSAVRSTRLKLLPLAPAAALAAAMVAIFIARVNPHTCYVWPFEAHNLSVLGAIDGDRRQHFPGKRITLANSWTLEPSFNFYRTTRHLDWLAPIERERLARRDNDYVYAFTTELSAAGGQPHTEMASYGDTGTVLWRVENGSGR